MNRHAQKISSLKALVFAACLVWTASAFPATPLASFDYHISGTFLQVSPPRLSVPKGIAGSILVSVVSGGSTNNAAVTELTTGAYVQAVIRGPAFATPQTIVAAPNSPLILPVISLVGQYELDNIELVDSTTGAVRLEGSPSTVPVNVFDQLLISTVTSQPLTLDQIQQAGIDIDESSFQAVQFNVEFVVNGQTFPVTFPVVSPIFTESTELIPADEVQAQLTAAAVINQKIAATMVQLPPALQTAGLNLQIQGINFQPTDPGPGQSLSLPIPPIPALMVIPGSVGYLHEFFNVQIFTENGAPQGSGLSVGNLEATLQLPPGPDGIASTNWADPGDDPLRFARTGTNQITQPSQPVVDPGPDGVFGDADDIALLQPGETGQAQFYVEGLQQGLAVMNVALSGELYGLADGPVHISGVAAGSVLVRNPSFSLTFTHPDVVRVGEPYQASITLLNTGVTTANLVQVTLNKNSISGAVLATTQPETVKLGTILPGQSATATYNMVAETTGQIEFSDLTTSDASLTGQFNFTMAVDAQGVPLSPDTIALPDYVNSLPADLLAAANVVLGEALSIATAPKLPPGIVPMGSAIVTRRVLDLAEAGQRVQYGDPLSRVLPDLLRDWQGGRVADDGFDSLLRTSDPGAQWRTILMQDMEAADHLDGTQRALNQAADLAGLGQQFVLASAGMGQSWVVFTGETNVVTGNQSSVPYAMVYGGTNSEWAMTPFQSNAVFKWTFTNGPSAADMAVLEVQTNGQVQEFRWQVSAPPVTAIYQFNLSDPTQRLQVDSHGTGTIDSTLAASRTTVDELPPSLVAVQQDLTVLAGRPSPACVGPNYGNYGTVVAVVYSKPMTQLSAGANSSYTVDGNNGADSVQIQPSGRVALLNLRKGISAIIPRKMTISGVTDVRGNPLVANPVPIQCFYPGTTNLFTGGVAVNGRVLLGNGAPAIDVPVTLTMYDGQASDTGCMLVTRRVSQVLTDSGGNYNFDYVMSGIPYSMSASDTSDLPSNAVALVEQSIISTQPNTQVLQELINASSDPNSLLSLLSAGSLDQAVAIVQGLDRAVVNDSVGIGSSREGQTVPIILRFRGRGTVTGNVLASDGITPVPYAAVNLFPDPSSLELGRGVFADGTGAFSFPGIPLGEFTVQVSTSDHRGATAVGVLTTPGGSTNINISLPDIPVYYGELRGTVFDTDNVTPIANATVYVGHYSVTTMNGIVATATTDATGSWDATNVPIAVWDVAAATFDHTRQGVRKSITPVASQPTYVNITLQAATTVYGQVQYDNGTPVPNALVAGGVALVTTDTNGNFQLQGVPVGSATISAGLQANPAAGIPFTRLGSSSLNVIPGAANYVVVKLNAAGRIFGTVYDSQGNFQPNIEVAIPDPLGGGFYYTYADTNGYYSFDNMGLGSYLVSAPANATAPQLDVNQLSAQVASGDESQILAAFQEAVTVFVGSNDPLINGDDLNFAPSAWGYDTASLNFDGANVQADIHFIPQGSVSGTVLNGQGIPIGAEVQLNGLGPDETGAPKVTVRGTTTSDPATGHFSFTNSLLAGNWTLQAASPFYPVVVKTNGYTTPFNLNVTGVVLQFPPVNDVNGSIAGHVYNPDGTLVSEGAMVHINIATNYEIQTDTNGFFDTQTEFPAIGVTYEVDVFDPASGLRGRNFVAMTPGITNFVDVHLLARDASIQVTVLRAEGGPAVGAQLELDQNTYPFGSPLFANTDSNGMALFTSLWRGSYSVMATYTESSTRLFARGAASVVTNQTASISLTMGATGTIEGTFVKQDGITPVYGANVSIGGLGLASTDTNGYFQFDGVPLGIFTITSSDPVTGGNAVTTTSLNYDGQVQTVSLVEATLGTVSGLVLDSFGSGFAAGASVMISFSDGLTPGRTVTSAPDGSFSFPGSPMGGFSLNALYNVPGAFGLAVSGRASGTLSTVSNTAMVNIVLQPLSGLKVRVLETDGVTPAQNVLVTVNGTQQDTATNGTATFTNLTIPNNYNITAISQVTTDQFDGASTNFTLTSATTNAVVTLVLPGTGNIAGTVLASDGSTPAGNVQVTFTSQSALFGGESESALSDAQGHFSFSEVPLGPYIVTAVDLALSASENGTLSTERQTNQVVLQLGGSGTILGELVRADGVTPVGGEFILIQFTSQSKNPGRATVFTGSDGKFQFNNVPLGSVEISSAATNFDGVIDFTVMLTTNDQVINLGLVPYDESDPMVVDVSPTNTAIGVPIASVVNLQFSKALDSNSISAAGIFIQGTNGIVDSLVTLLADTNGVMDLVRIAPKKPLQSLSTYSVIVLAGDLPGPDGSIIASGPLDLAGRELSGPFESDFTTADQTPPVLLSIFPSNNAVQIDPASVPRLVFNKTLNPTSFVFTVTGPQGTVAGTSALGINGQVLTFLPTVDLAVNATYTMTVRNVFDLAGNAAVGQPFTTTFATLVTIGPTISSLEILSNMVPAAGATVTVVAVLATNKPGDTVAFSQDFNSIGTVSNSPYQVKVMLPASGSTTIRAIPTDQYGNSGQYVELTIQVQQPKPPVITFAGSFSDGLHEGIRTNYWNVSQTTAGLYFIGLSNGLLHLEKPVASQSPADLQNVAVNLNLEAIGGSISNDFSVQVTFTNAVLGGADYDQIQLNLGFQDGSIFDDVYDNSSHTNVHVWNGGQNGTTPLTNTSGTFRIARSGSAVTGYFDGSPVFTESNTSAVTSVNFVLQNNNTDDPIAVDYFDFSMTAGSIKTQPVPAGSLVTVEVNASSESGISNLTAIVTGAATGSVEMTNASQLLAIGSVPSTATTLEPVQVLAQATDILGNPSEQQSLTIPVVDGTPPTLAVLIPTNEAHLAAGPSFSISTEVADNSSNVTLSVAISGSFTFTQTMPLILTPNVPVTNVISVPLTTAPTNGGPITATFTVTDSAGNNSVAVRTYWLPNTPGPVISSLTIASNLPPVAGSKVPIEALLAGSYPGGTVTFTQDGSIISVETNAPYQTIVTLPATGSTTITAVAVDQFGNVGAKVTLTITVEVNIPPSIQFVRVSPASGPIPSGSSFTVQVNASGDSNLFDITAAIGGAGNPGNFQSTGTNLLVIGSVPSTATAGGQVQITAQAVDGLGQSTGPQQFNLPVSDGTPPSISIVSPEPNAQLTPGASFTMSVLVGDNSSNVTLRLSITSAVLNSNQTISVPLTPNLLTTNDLIVTLPSEPTNGDPIFAMITATDQAGNRSTASTVFWLPGTQTTVIWDRQALGQTLTCSNGTGTYSWPNNNNWSQSVVLGTPCGSGESIPIQPSNWSTTNYPNGTNLDVILGNAGGAPANLDVSVNLHSLTIQSNGGLNMAGNTSISAVNYEFQGDGGITRGGNVTLTLNGGIMEKSAGTNTFTIDSGTVLRSVNGTFAVDSGTLALPGNNSSYNNGGFNVASNATILLIPGGTTSLMDGVFAGSGEGSVLFDAGTLSAGPDGVTFDFSGTLFQWSAGNLIGLASNINEINLTGTNSPNTGTLDRSAEFYNAGLVRQSSSNSFDLRQNAVFQNLAKGTYDLASDAGVFTDDYNPQYFNNFGVLRKSAGTNVSTISVTFDNLGGLIDVESGTLSLANSGSSSNGIFTIGAGATLDLTGAQNPAWAGQMSGSGSGAVAFRNGSITARSLVLNFAAGLFQWSGGLFGGTMSNVNNISFTGTNAGGFSGSLDRNAVFNNANLVQHVGVGGLDLRQNALFQNLSTGTYDFESDAGITTDDYGPQNFNNYGLVRKSSGTNTSTISISFNNLSGKIDVESGTLSLANSGSSSNAVITVGADAALDLTGGQSPTWSGLITGQGAGIVLFDSGYVHAASLALNFVTNQFQWSGGSIGGLVTNVNVVNLTGTNAEGTTATIDRASAFYNFSVLHHAGVGRFDLRQNAAFENMPSATYNLASDGGIFTDDYGPQNFNNFGTFRKSAGTNSTISISFNNLGGLVDVESGTLTLANNGSSSNATFTVGAGAVLDVTGGQSPVWTGQMAGQGSGVVSLQNGYVTVHSVGLNFVDGLFQWSGGYMGGVATNLNVIGLTGTNANGITGILDRGSYFYNSKLVRHSGAGRLDLRQNALFENMIAGTYDFESDGGIFTDDYGPQYFYNYGTLRKSGGTNTSAITISFDNFGGTVDVESGALSLANNGSSSNGTFIVGPGSLLDITGGQSPTWTGQMNGQGAGTIIFEGGYITANSVSLNFPGNLLQWTGGSIGGVASNLNVITLSGTNISGYSGTLDRGSVFYNLGLVRQTNSSRLDLRQNASIQNTALGIYDFNTDGGISTDDYGPQYFYNSGTIRKSGGTNMSTISVSFINQNGSIEVDSGTLSLGGSPYVQSNGTFTVQLGGTNLGQSGQLSAGNVTLSGTLHVILAPGFTPPVGTQFQILSSSSLSGTFSTLNVPGGIAISYPGNTVVASVISALVKSGSDISTVSEQPTLAISRIAGNLATLEWFGNTNIVVESSSSLSPGVQWSPVTNIPMAATSNTFNVTVPITNAAQYFRLRQRQSN